EVVVTRDPAEIASRPAVVLPGVGSFQRAVANLKEYGLWDILAGHLKAGKPFLGICLGFQLLFTGSEENGWTEGLEIFRGKAVRLPSCVKVPHMGWNRVECVHPSPLVAGIPEGALFYFDHSYCVVPDEPGVVAGVTHYGFQFCSLLSHGNIFGTQFHPEKSSTVGLKMLANFKEVVERARDTGP
ncbi:MAG: imidazole glycerol phosphate synthase subunit HisH, partial [Clostridia bacterium]|nr:imidazole glycerol phosphate synthase subunit HisH [Clostridia bacterium]